MLGNLLPYVNFHELNLDWIVKNIETLSKENKEQDTALSDLDARTTANENWIKNYNTDVIEQATLAFLESILARMIFVEISDGGYITYTIPESWEEITFNTTGLDINLEMQPEFGHLVLSY